MAWLKAFGTGMSAGGQWLAGDAYADAGKSVNAQMISRAGTRRAVAQREAEEERRTGDLILSRATAVMAAQGGTTDDAGAAVQLARIQAEKEYRALSRLWTGEDEAAGMEESGAIAEAEGKAKRTASRFGAASSLVSGAASWYDRNNTPKPKKTTAPKYSPYVKPPNSYVRGTR